MPIPGEMQWMSEWDVGIWHRLTREYKNPSFSIPPYLQRKYATGHCTGMPGGPYVQTWSVVIDRGTKRTELGEYPIIANIEVKWKDVIHEALNKRKAMLKGAQQELDEYHSQCALSNNSLLLNEIQRKINRSKIALKDVIRMKESSSIRWDNLIQQLHEMAYTGLKFDPYEVDRYVEEHKSSTIIPGTRFTRSKKWSQLNGDELKHLYNMCKAYLEELITNWDEMKMKILMPNAVGRGIRARSPKISSLSASYQLEFDRSRQVAFVPFLSAWFAFMTKEVKESLWNRLKQEAENILGCRVLLPPLAKGAYWKIIRDELEKGHSMVNGDGSNWEMSSATLSGVYCEAVDDGIPQYMSGAAMTSLNATFAMLRSTEVRVPQSGRLECIGVLGDDEVLIGPKSVIDTVRTIPGIWEIDDVATRNRVMLGMIILPDGKGTFPGMYRITVDRADKKIAMNIGERYEDIPSAIPEDSFKVYREIMEEGTLNGEALIDAIAAKKMEEFWELWRVDRTSLIGELADYELEVLPEEYQIDEQ
jgi:hypothetical protein